MVELAGEAGGALVEDSCLLAGRGGGVDLGVLHRQRQTEPRALTRELFKDRFAKLMRVSLGPQVEDQVPLVEPLGKLMGELYCAIAPHEIGHCQIRSGCRR